MSDGDGRLHVSQRRVTVSVRRCIVRCCDVGLGSDRGNLDNCSNLDNRCRHDASDDRNHDGDDRADNHRQGSDSVCVVRQFKQEQLIHTF